MNWPCSVSNLGHSGNRSIKRYVVAGKSRGQPTIQAVGPNPSWAVGLCHRNLFSGRRRLGPAGLCRLLMLRTSRSRWSQVGHAVESVESLPDGKSGWPNSIGPKGCHPRQARRRPRRVRPGRTLAKKSRFGPLLSASHQSHEGHRSPVLLVVVVKWKVPPTAILFLQRQDDVCQLFLKKRPAIFWQFVNAHCGIKVSVVVKISCHVEIRIMWNRSLACQTKPTIAGNQSIQPGDEHLVGNPFVTI